MEPDLQRNIDPDLDRKLTLLLLWYAAKFIFWGLVAVAIIATIAGMLPNSVLGGMIGASLVLMLWPKP